MLANDDGGQVGGRWIKQWVLSYHYELRRFNVVILT